MSATKSRRLIRPSSSPLASETEWRPFSRTLAPSAVRLSHFILQKREALLVLRQTYLLSGHRAVGADGHLPLLVAEHGAADPAAIGLGAQIVHLAVAAIGEVLPHFLLAHCRRSE